MFNMQKAYNYINKKLFDNELDQAYLFELSNMESAIFVWNSGWLPAFDGVCVPDQEDYLIGINENLTNNEKFDTLVHEMVHIWMMDNNLGSGHGKRFQKKCREAMHVFYGEVLQ